MARAGSQGPNRRCRTDRLLQAEGLGVRASTVFLTQTTSMDKHYLTPLFEPQAVVVFCGRKGEPASQTAQGRALYELLRAQRYAGTLHFLDIGMSGTTGTLADLAQTRADLAIIALPPK